MCFSENINLTIAFPSSPENYMYILKDINFFRIYYFSVSIYY